MKNDPVQEKEIVNRLLGAWSLVAWFEVKPNGERVYPLGEDAIGQIMYSADGHIAAQLMRGQPDRFRSDDWR
ncbi:MAG: lipocalin-like domain-containing protein [Verrucomicrobia bacterium]|nr:lipocalin-like domain-containing protein [Verrucomicrobiota bacterium]MBV8481648.1 lipocalin-like domain-containing protein [Verrucomicrobiota bacterium]